MLLSRDLVFIEPLVEIRRHLSGIAIAVILHKLVSQISFELVQRAVLVEFLIVQLMLVHVDVCEIVIALLLNALVVVGIVRYLQFSLTHNGRVVLHGQRSLLPFQSFEIYKAKPSVLSKVHVH